MKRLIISPLVLVLVLVSPMSAPVAAAAGSADPGAGVDLTPSGDVAATNVVPVVAGSAVKGGSLWAQVDDGSSFSAADDSATLVRTKLRSKTATHTTSYAGAPAGTITDVVVNLRATRTPLARGTVRVRLYDGSTLLGSGPPHALAEAYTNFSDDFGDLAVADASNLRTTVKFTNTSGKGELFYTALWLHAAYQTASDAPPAVSVLSPTDGAAVRGPIVVSGTSGDDVGVSSVSLQIDGGAPIALSTAGTWTYPWDTTDADGTHRLTVTAADTAGQTSSQSISINVASAVSCAPPAGGGYSTFSLSGPGRRCRTTRNAQRWFTAPPGSRGRQTTRPIARWSIRPRSAPHLPHARWPSTITTTPGGIRGCCPALTVSSPGPPMRSSSGPPASGACRTICCGGSPYASRRGTSTSRTRAGGR